MNSLDIYYIILQIAEYAIAPIALVFFVNRTRALFSGEEKLSNIVSFNTKIELIFAIIGSNLLFGLSFLAHNDPSKSLTPWVFIVCLLLFFSEVAFAIALLNKVRMNVLIPSNQVPNRYLVVNSFFLLAVIVLCSIYNKGISLYIDNYALKVIVYYVGIAFVFLSIYFIIFKRSKEIFNKFQLSEVEIDRGRDAIEPQKSINHYNSAIRLGIRHDNPELHRVLMDKAEKLIQLEDFKSALSAIEEARKAIENLNYPLEIKDEVLLRNMQLLLKLGRKNEALALRKSLKTAYGERSSRKLFE